MLRPRSHLLWLALLAVSTRCAPGEVPARPDASASDAPSGTTPDAAPPSVDAAPPSVDAAPPGVDAAPPGVDAAPPGVDAAPPGVDAAPGVIDAGVPDACVPDCAGKVCGGDGCGGSCGRCDPNLACSTDQTQCECWPLSFVTYTFDFSDVEWNDGLLGVDISASHVDAEGHWQPSKSVTFFIDDDTTTRSMTFLGCPLEPWIRVFNRKYIYARMICAMEVEDVVDRLWIQVPSPTRTGDTTCSAPPLE